MEPVYVEATITDRLVRINKNDSMDLYSWRDCKTKPSYWFKIKPCFNINKFTNYEYYTIKFDKKPYKLSRIVFKAHNNDWDITDTSDTNYIDHINNNSLDNRIENLRIITHQQNQWNTKAKGYCWNKTKNKWQAKITVNNKEIYLGYFTEEADARNAYLEGKSLYHSIA